MCVVKKSAGLWLFGCFINRVVTTSSSDGRARFPMHAQSKISICKKEYTSYNEAESLRHNNGSTRRPWWRNVQENAIYGGTTPSNLHFWHQIPFCSTNSTPMTDLSGSNDQRNEHGDHDKVIGTELPCPLSTKQRLGGKSNGLFGGQYTMLDSVPKRPRGQNTMFHS